MKWISVKHTHFVDIIRYESGGFFIRETDNTPPNLFMVSVIDDNNIIRCDYDCVYIGDSGFISSNGMASHIDIFDVTHWCLISEPKLKVK